MMTDTPSMMRLGSIASGGIPPGVKLDQVRLPKLKIKGPIRIIL